MTIVCQFITYLFLERTEMVEIQLETYTVDSVSAHRKIRQDTLCFLSSILTVSCNSFPLPFLKGIAAAVFAVFCYTLWPLIIWVYFLVFFICLTWSKHMEGPALLYSCVLLSGRSWTQSWKLVKQRNSPSSWNLLPLRSWAKSLKRWPRSTADYGKR